MMRPYPEKFKSSKVLRTLQDNLQDEYLYDNDDATFTPEMFVAEMDSLASTSEELGYKSFVIKELFYEGANFEDIAFSCSRVTAKQQDELLTFLNVDQLVHRCLDTLHRHSTRYTDRQYGGKLPDNIDRISSLFY